jgi:cell division septation protein DedD
MSQRLFPMGPPSSAGDALAQQSAASPDNIPAPPALEDEHKKRIPLIWIPVVICLGLLVAAGYLGGRIYASRTHETAPARAAVAVARTPAALAQSPAEISAVAPAVDNPPAENPPVESASQQILTVRTHDDPSLVPPDDLSLIHPQPGDRYVQISALNTAAAHRFVEQLRHGPLEPHLAQGPTPTILRVLIGPFSGNASLLDTMTDLKAAGIDCFIREY